MFTPSPKNRAIGEGGGGAGLVLLSTVEAVSASSADIEDTFDDTYDHYLLVASGITSPILANVEVRLKIGGSYITTSTYKYHAALPTSAASTYVGSAGANSRIVLGSLGLGSEKTANFTLRITNPELSAIDQLIGWTGEFINGSSNIVSASGAAFNTNLGALTGVRFFLGDSALISGTFRLYGIDK